MSTPDFDALHIEVRELNALLEEREPWRFSWNALVLKHVDNICRWVDRRGRPDPHTKRTS